MSGHRPFEDARFPDAEGFAECFLCGNKVDPRDPRRGTYEVSPAGSQAPIHLPCAAKFIAQHRDHELEIAYRKSLVEMSDFAMKQLH